MIHDHNEPGFTGVWIPAEVWFDERLTWFDRCLWATISSLRNVKKKTFCTATNGWLAERFDSSPGTIANTISKLRKLGLIKDCGTAEQRALLATFEQSVSKTTPSQGSEPPFTSGLTPLHKEVNEGGSPNIVLEQRKNTAARTRFENAEKIKAVLRVWYNRKPTVNWPHTEDRMIASLLDRPDVMQEFAELKRFREKSRKFFPQSVMRLLENWDSTLDRARQPEIKPALNQI